MKSSYFTHRWYIITAQDAKEYQQVQCFAQERVPNCTEEVAKP